MIDSQRERKKGFVVSREYKCTYVNGVEVYCQSIYKWLFAKITYWKDLNVTISMVAKIADGLERDLWPAIYLYNLLNVGTLTNSRMLKLIKLK